MNKVRMLLFLGVFLALLPFTGFPIFWKDMFIILVGFSVFYVGFLMNRSAKSRMDRQKFDNFSENHDFAESQNNENLVQ